MHEPIRLVIWDLDETFWSGTLTEGGISYCQAHHDIVVALSHRGIVNSICSKNDQAPVQTLLEAHGIWDFFIFPSIDWSAKAPRVRAIIEAAQLRPETVLFVDDNPGNRAQVECAVPGIQVADETRIASFLDDPLFAGRKDVDLDRLRQYKLLAQRRSANVGSTGDTIDFLRGSDIRATIIYDVEDHIDRAVELINRTNQLNFTKQRLRDDPVAAARQLLDEISPFYARAGLVAVSDRFGDYGIVGFFLIHGLNAHANLKLRHFCFSCRTLGMGLEQWVYALLGRPQLEIVGEVVSDIDQPVDWINAATQMGQRTSSRSRTFGEVRIRGGCELEVLEHFFRAEAQTVRVEVNAMRGGFYWPAHHSGLLAHALSAPTSLAAADDLSLLGRLTMDASFYDAETFAPCPEQTLIVYSPSGDASVPVYRHRSSSLDVPVWIRESLFPDSPYRGPEGDALYNQIFQTLTTEFDPLPFDTAHWVERYRTILSHAPANALMVILLPNTITGQASAPHELQAALNSTFRAAGRDFDNVRFIEMTDLVASPTEIADFYMHFDRAVYRRLFEAIVETYEP